MVAPRYLRFLPRALASDAAWYFSKTASLSVDRREDNSSNCLEKSSRSFVRRFKVDCSYRGVRGVQIIMTMCPPL